MRDSTSRRVDLDPVLGNRPLPRSTLRRDP